MDNELLRKIQLTQFEIFKQVHQIAQRNNITVYLYAGTLLGAVRHQGFIPWDDDLDIMVLREDYERLMVCLKAELADTYWLQNYETDPQYWQPYAKVRKKGTLYKETALKDIEDDKCGIWIDIFPVDKTPKNSGTVLTMRRFIVETIALSLRRKELKLPMRSFSRRYIPALLLWGIFTSKALRRMQCRVMKMYSAKKCRYYVDLAGMEPLKKLIYPVEWFEKAEKIPFEDGLYEVPAAYDPLLTQFYGDYMTPPPEDKRGGHDVGDHYPIIV